MNDQKILEEVQLNCATLRKRNDRIIEYLLQEEHILDVEDIKLIVEVVNDMCSEQKHAMMVITTAHNGTTREARIESFERMKQHDHAIAEAVVIKSLPTRLAADFFYKIYKPSHPCKFFKSKMKAEEWLKIQIQGYLEK